MVDSFNFMAAGNLVCSINAIVAGSTVVTASID